MRDIKINQRSFEVRRGEKQTGFSEEKSTNHVSSEAFQNVERSTVEMAGRIFSGEYYDEKSTSSVDAFMGRSEYAGNPPRSPFKKGGGNGVSPFKKGGSEIVSHLEKRGGGVGSSFKKRGYGAVPLSKKEGRDGVFSLGKEEGRVKREKLSRTRKISGAVIMLVGIILLFLLTDLTSIDIFFWLFFFAMFWYRLDSRISISGALIGLVVIMFLSAGQGFGWWKTDSLQEQIAVAVYFFLVIGVLKQIWEYKTLG